MKCIIISNNTLQDIYHHLLFLYDLPDNYRKEVLKASAIKSIIYLYLEIKAEELEKLTGHHVVVHNSNKDITESGNTCIISISSVWV